MSRTRGFSSYFTRIFCLRICCPARENASSLVPHPSKSSRPVSSHHTPNDTSSASTAHSRPFSTHSRIGDTPPPSPTRVIIIEPEQDPPQLASPPSPTPVLSEDVGPRICSDSLSCVESQPVHTPHVSPQALPTHTDAPSTAPETHREPVVHALEIETGRIVPPEITITSPTPAPDSDAGTEHTPFSSLAIFDAELIGRPFDSDRARHRSLCVPQLVRRPDSARFSAPVRSATSRVKAKTGNTRESTRQGKRTPLLPIGPAAGTAWREKKDSRWSRETSKQETQKL